jgi:hypothetical protein
MAIEALNARCSQAAGRTLGALVLDMAVERVTGIGGDLGGSPELLGDSRQSPQHRAQTASGCWGWG